MAAPQRPSPVSQDTLITLKINLNGEPRKLKLPLRDLSAAVLPDKLRQCLNITPEQTATFERFSDSAGGFVILDPAKPQVFKTLLRAAKAKLKLRLKATVTPLEPKPETTLPEVEENTTAPTIVHSPQADLSSLQATLHTIAHPRDSAAMDNRSIGAGIFQFREARASQQTLVDTSEAPAPRPAPTLAFAPCQMPLRGREPVVQLPNTNGYPWSLHCNECDVPMSDAHFHCGICDAGDYDLCEACVASGKLCPGEGHWLIKRFIKNGCVISSQTERISPRMTRQEIVPASPKEMPGAFTDDSKTLAEEFSTPTRTCNNCIVSLPEREFVTCKACEDFDLCLDCHSQNKHGHHPAHAFDRATEDTVLALAAESMLAPGRNVRHNAICDGCDKKIYGVRHKCLNCPDWDYCTDCMANSRISHPRHRFAALYQPIADQHASHVRHFGVYCDGPLCKNNNHPSYITGVRYKCAVCNDLDFCAACEAVPGNGHNRTHPLIKFKAPVRNVSITTESEDKTGQVCMLGDHRAMPAMAALKNASTETTQVPPVNSATAVQTIAEIKPTEVKEAPHPYLAKEMPLWGATKAVKPVNDLGNGMTPQQMHATGFLIPHASSVTGYLSATKGMPEIHPDGLNACFVKDTIQDGTVFEPGTRFSQVWTIRNPGPKAWPAGCSVRFVGGDNMLNVENGHPASVGDIAKASETNLNMTEVKVGELAAFNVTLKAPSRLGKSISYWRVKAPDGSPFGHRLWCDIDVKRAETLTATPAFNPFKINPMQQAMSHDHTQQEQAKLQMRQAELARLVMRQHRAVMEQGVKVDATTAAADEFGKPPAYESTENLSSRLAAMRADQQLRREQMVAAMNTQRQQITAMSQLAAPYAPASTEDDRVRKEAAKQRVEYIKAKILKTREDRAKAMEAKHAAEGKRAETQKDNEKLTLVDYFGRKNEANVDSKPEIKKEEDMEGSSMVFPKLDKESPSSSTYQSATSSSAKGKAAYVENEDGEVERSATPVVAPTAISEPSVSSPQTEEGYETLTDDLEVLSADDESEDDGFLTDEEYDILDASDRETVHSP